MTTVDEVVVTGTRIQNSGMTSPTPLTVLGTEQIKQTAPSSADDILNQLPAFRPSSGPNQVQRNAGSISTGQSLANLRGLGSQRTLLLIDGQRPVPTNSSATTSTSIIPLELIKRVEVVTGGASAAYGSDAVSGVVNFVLKDRIDQLQGAVYAGQSSQGDNKEIGVSLADGFRLLNDRLQVVVGADYNKNDGIGNIYTRDWAAVEPGNSGTPISFGATRAAGTPAFGWAEGVEYATQTPGGVINTAKTATGATSTVLNQLSFNADGSTTKLVRGPVFGNLMINSSSNHIATPLAQWQLKQPLEQFSSMAKATYDINQDTTAFFQAGYATSNVFTKSQYHQTPTVTILATNPYLPAAMKALMAANNITQFDMGRVDTEWLGTTGDNTYETIQASAGLKGKVFQKFNWNLTYGYGKSLIDSQVYGTREANLAAAEYAVVDATGNIVCGSLATNPNFAANRLTNTITVANVQPGCVPLNPFGTGAPSAAARAYVAGIEYTKDQMLRHDLAFDLNGQLFDLPAGPVSFAAGAEYRRDSLRQTADALQQQGLYSSGNNKSYGGRETVKEAYLEVEVPLLADLPLVRSLGLNGAVRATDYKISGQVTTWKIGGTYEPIEGVRLRATRSRDIRAPSLSDLFLVGGISATGSFVNPFNGQSARLPVQTVGNPDLKAEEADTFAVGGTFQGRTGFLPGARLSVDYYKIKVNDVIASVSATDILARCYQGVQSYCSAIQFDSSSFGIAKVFVQPFNQSVLETEGVDYEVGYRTDLSALHLPGSVDMTVFATNLRHLKTTDRPGPSGVTVDNAGVQGGSPKWVGSAYFNYRLDPFTVGVQVRAFSDIRYSALFIGPGEAGYSPTLSNSINKNVYPALAYVNLNGTYDFKVGERRYQVFANANNLFDTNPPAYAIAAINLGGNPYDYVGRTFKLGLRFGF
ncbi:TonB-dependent receptor plug domain-containing protein [Phenylobacterium aquaticum]|uniref:TonB-dependent receptor plug domain-containing protein n=1 Tax=Phenylobacterium aquaticum TaxID=1763816 RepID=UPI001F5C339A|nr:TonB-dependent receptor [Phenylobacterium aquaticum]